MGCVCGETHMNLLYLWIFLCVKLLILTHMCCWNPKEFTRMHGDCPMGFDQDLPIRQMTLDPCCPSRLYYLTLRISTERVMDGSGSRTD